MCSYTKCLCYIKVNKYFLFIYDKKFKIERDRYPKEIMLKFDRNIIFVKTRIKISLIGRERGDNGLFITLVPKVLE